MQGIEKLLLLKTSYSRRFGCCLAVSEYLKLRLNAEKQEKRFVELITHL
jgi:hypothetical protein